MKNLLVFFAVIFVVIEVTSGVKPSKCTCAGPRCTGGCHIYEPGDKCSTYALAGHSGHHTHGHSHSHGHSHGHGHHPPDENPYELAGAEGGGGLSDNDIYSEAGGYHHGKCSFCGKHGCHGQCHVYEEAGHGGNSIYSLAGPSGGGHHHHHHHHHSPSQDPIYDTVGGGSQSNHISPNLPPRPPGGHPPVAPCPLKRKGCMKKR